MDVTRITVEHVRVATEAPFEKVTKAFEQQIGHFDASAYQQLNSGIDPDEVRAKIKAMEGSSGFILFRTTEKRSFDATSGKRLRFQD